jgi:predicted NAD/FAD-binding protein
VPPASVDAHGDAATIDHVVVATDARQALAALAWPTPDHAATRGAVRYNRGTRVVLRDERRSPA